MVIGWRALVMVVLPLAACGPKSSGSADPTGPATDATGVGTMAASTSSATDNATTTSTSATVTTGTTTTMSGTGSTSAAGTSATVTTGTTTTVSGTGSTSAAGSTGGTSGTGSTTGISGGTTGASPGMLGPGVWSAVQYDQSNSGLQSVAAKREDGFMLRVHETEGVIETAACRDDGWNTSIASSLCHGDPISDYQCRCYAYEVDGAELRWLQYTAGATPPAGAPANDPNTVITALTDVATGVSISPLPLGLFGSGAQSVFIFESRTDVYWDDPPKKPPGSPPSCGCL